jgi:hypothetical protein
VFVHKRTSAAVVRSADSVHPSTAPPVDIAAQAKSLSVVVFVTVCGLFLTEMSGLPPCTRVCAPACARVILSSSASVRMHARVRVYARVARATPSVGEIGTYLFPE